jgi:hypothetical protein
VARFRQTSGSHHSAITLDSEAGKDAIFYLAEDGVTQWMIRHVVSGHDFSLRYLGSEKMKVDTNGTVTATAFNPPSDRNLKENFQPVSALDVLNKVATMPNSRWNFIGDEATPHVGPMAQDFHAAFGLGTDDKHIATVDAAGVALAAIQGLNEKVEVRSQKAEISIQKLEEENAELKARLEKIEQLLNHKLQGGAK